MKFLCTHCDAKYQISDDRVAGRTLRMKCRKCGEDIIIKAAFSPSASRSQPTAQHGDATRPVSSSGTRGAASARARDLSASGLKEVASVKINTQVTTTPSATELPLHEQWHAAIENKPAGPFAIDDIKQFIDNGKLGAESLVWKETFADWTAVEKVPELKDFLKKSLSSWPMPASASEASISRPVSEKKQAPRSTFEVAAQAAQKKRDDATGPSMGFDSTVIDDSGLKMEFGAPKGSAQAEIAAPLGIALPAEAIREKTETAQLSTHFGTDSEPSRASLKNAVQQLARKSSESLRPAFDAVSKQLSSLRPAGKKPRLRLTLPVLAVLIASVSFGVTMAVLTVGRITNPQDGKALAAVTAGDETSSEPLIKLAEIDPELIAIEEETQTDTEPEEIEEEKTASAAKSSTIKRTTRNTPSSSTGGSNLSKSDQELLARFAQQEGGGPTGVKVPTTASSTAKQPLSSTQVRAVVSKNRSELQRCYEVAARSTGSTQPVRIDVRLHVSPVGSVSKATVDGPNVGNLKNCILSSVRRWRFPSSSYTTEVPFPLVFQPGA